MASEIERLDQLLAEQEATVRRAFLRYVAIINSDVVMSMVVEQLEAGDVAGAMRILESHISRFADVLPTVQATVGAQTSTELARALGDIAMAISFDTSNPRAAAAIRTHRLKLITEFKDSQYRTVEQALNRQFAEGAGAQATARAFRESIGLTTQQEAYVASYRRLLQQGSRDAIDRALRDRRFDERVLQAAQRPLTPRQIDHMVMRYRANAVAARAETIARTEAGRAVAEARQESTEQMLEQTGIERDRLERKWNRIGDKRVRDWHDSMQGQTRSMDEPFVDGHGNQLMYPHDPNAPAETVINCRCGLTFRVRAAA